MIMSEKKNRKNILSSPPLSFHDHEQLQIDLGDDPFLSDENLIKWSKDYCSTSQHLLTFYSLAIGLNAKSIVEFGFGRSSFVFLKAASFLNSKVTLIDNRDFSYLLSEQEKMLSDFLVKDFREVSNSLRNNEISKEGVDICFFDVFSNPAMKESIIKRTIEDVYAVTKQNGILMFHDTIISEYKIKEVVDDFKSAYDCEILTLPYNYGLTILRKKEESEFGSIKNKWFKK